jgi:ubiquitin carboxyl-terminal hydrolase L3
LDKLLATCIPLDPYERALALESSEEVSAAHADAAAQGDSAAPDAEAEVDFHYVCYVQSHQTGRLYEMDGDKKGPLDKHVILREDEDMLSNNALSVVREFVQREGGTNMNFSLLALAQIPMSSC